MWHLRSSTSNKPSCSSSWTRRSASARCSWRGGKLAKVWHPDIAPPGKQFEHERHLKVINEAADTLERLAEQSRGGKVTRNAVKVCATAARKAREEAGRRNYEEEQRQRAAAADQQKHDPFGSRMPDHSVVHRYARCLSYPEWGVGTVNGIYFTGDPDDSMQQWARVSFHVGIRTVPAGSLQFVDFSKPDPGADRVQRFMTAAKHALAEGDFKLAAKRLVFARDAEPSNAAGPAPDDDRVLAGGRLLRRRALRARLGARRARAPGAAPHRRAHLRGHGLAVAGDRRRRARDRRRARATRPPGSASAACACAASTATARATRSSAPARCSPSEEGLLDLALIAHLAGDLGTEVSACEQATRGRAGVRRAPGRATRTRSPAPTAPRTASPPATARSRSRDDPEVRALAESVRARAPRELAA